MKHILKMLMVVIAIGMMVAFGNRNIHSALFENADEDTTRTEILRVIEMESKAFWNKDYDAWASCWVHAPYIRTMGWWERGGVTVVEGWDQRGPRTKAHMKENPDPNPQNVIRKNVNIRIYRDAAWVTFDQYGKDTGEPDMDMPGLSRETRFLEKHNGQWKIVYVGWLLQGESQSKKADK